VTTETAILPASSLTNIGDYLAVPRQTDDDRIIYLWVHKPRKTSSTNTIDQYGRIAQSFREAIGLPLQAVTYADLAGWYEGLEGSANSRRTKVAAIKSLFSFCLEVGYLRANPAKLLGSPAQRDARHERVLSEAEVHAMIAAARTPRDKLIIRLLYASGCRVSELCALRWADVIPTTNNKAVLVIHGKGGKQREAGISAETYRALLTLRKEAKSTDPVFVSNRNRAITRTVINRMVAHAARAAGIDTNDRPVSPHWLRHSHATHAINRGANVKIVQEQLGHSSLAVTSRYAHASESSADYLGI